MQPKLEMIVSKNSVLPKSKKMAVTDFDFLGELGHGGFGRVYLVRKKNSTEKLALKIIRKSLLLKTNDQRLTVDEIFNEKNIMMKSDNPFLVKLQGCFQDETNVYFLMEVMEGGNMFNYIRNTKKQNFSEEQTKFYCAEVVLALEHLHSTMQVIYRDLKPENILFSKDGHVKLGDFGLAKKADTMQGDAKGTPDFMAPEIYSKKEYTKMVDYWSLGCLIYELLYGKPAFSSHDKDKGVQRILAGKFTFLSEVSISDEAKSIITKLLQVKVSNRLGFNGIEEIKNHPFFASINWKAILEKKVTPPIQNLELKFNKITTVPELTGPIGEKLDEFTYMPESFPNQQK